MVELQIEQGVAVINERTTPDQIVQASIARSLKRIADSLENVHNDSTDIASAIYGSLLTANQNRL